MSLPTVGKSIKFHLSLNVSDLQRAVDFYRVLFDTEPAKVHDDYAKFEPDHLDVVFSLVPHPPSSGRSLSHVGLRVPDPAMIEQIRRRLEEAGIATQVQENTVCSHARKSKCWVADPDRNFWEIYVVEEDLPPSPSPVDLPAPAVSHAPKAGPLVWEHGVCHPLPQRIPHEDGKVEEVRLVGTFNAKLTEEERRFLIKEAWRVLRNGGKILVHGLMADKPFSGAAPTLPALAAMVSRVPVHQEPLDVLRTAGFTDLQFVKFSEAPWFCHEGVELREVKLIGWKPVAMAAETARQVLYKGPFSQAVNDAGTIFLRGQRVTVSAAAYERLRQGPAADQFLFLDPQATPACSPCG
jgi:catechol 2,3-dioxygenase-like lactoylglutathione lyase family enzyme